MKHLYQSIIVNYYLDLLLFTEYRPYIIGIISLFFCLFNLWLPGIGFFHVAPLNILSKIVHNKKVIFDATIKKLNEFEENGFCT